MYVIAVNVRKCPSVTVHKPLLQMTDQQSYVTVRQTCLRAVAALYVALVTASLSMAPTISSTDAIANADGPDLLMDALSEVVGPLRRPMSHGGLVASSSGYTARNTSIRRRCKGYLAW